jgi:hypothetical protein
MVLKYHPDRSKDPRAADIFIAITESYDVINDPERRKQYDRKLMLDTLQASRNREPRVQTAHPNPPSASKTSKGADATRTRTSSPHRSATITVDVTRLSVLFSRGQFGEAEKLAKKIHTQDSRQPLPYAVMAEIARSRGDLKEAEKMLALAVQMDPRNDLYRTRYEELVRDRSVERKTAQIDYKNIEMAAPMAGAAMVLLACMYVVLGNEAPLLPSLSLVSTWTLGLVVMVLVSGVTIGASLSIGGYLDRFNASMVNSLGKVSPILALATISIVSFWLAAALYLVMGAVQRGFNYSTNRLVGAVAGASVLFAFAAGLSQGLNSIQVLVWSGNMMYIAALCGWMSADALRKA